MVNIVLHCQTGKGNNDDFYGQDGMIHTDLQKAVRTEVNFKGFGGFLTEDNLDNFLEACQEADVILLDAWTHPIAWDLFDNFDPYKAMANIAAKIKKINPQALVFALMMEGINTKAVHMYAKPIANYYCETIKGVLHWLNAKKANQ